MVDYKKEIEKMISDLKNENPNREIDFKEDYILDVNGTKIEVSILDIKEPMEKDDEKTNINKMQILFKTKDGYVLIAEVTEDNEIMIDAEGIKKSGLEDKVVVTGSDKIELREKDEKEKEKSNDQKKEDKERDDQDKPDIKSDLDRDKEEIARKYNVDSRMVIHISMDEKVTGDHRFEGLVKSARGYDSLYAVPGKDNYKWHLIGQKDGEETEINNEDNNKWGTNPDVTIQVEDKGEIKDVRPLAMVEIDSDSAYAIARDDTGMPQMIYCRQIGGNEKEYFGIIVPEAEGKNVMQQDPEQREFIDPKNNSNEDLDDKLKELEGAKSLDKRGVPSKEKGVQTYEIDGTKEQNKALALEEIKEDLYKRKEIGEKMKGAMPGYFDYMDKQIEKEAKEILKLMEENDSLTYEEAVKVVEERNNREPGGPTPDKKREH